MKKTITINGMSCSHCTGAVTKALNAINGVSNVEVSLEHKQATLDVENSVTDDMLKEAIDDQGYDVVSIQ